MRRTGGADNDEEDGGERTTTRVRGGEGPGRRGRGDNENGDDEGGGRWSRVSGHLLQVVT